MKLFCCHAIFTFESQELYKMNISFTSHINKIRFLLIYVYINTTSILDLEVFKIMIIHRFYTKISLHKNVYELFCVIKDSFEFPNLRVISEVFMTHCIYSYNITYPIPIVTLFSHCLIR